MAKYLRTLPFLLRNMYKKIIYTFLSLIIISLISSYYYSTSYAESFLINSYKKRTAKCGYLTNGETKHLAEKYSLSDSLFIKLGKGKYQFQAIDLPSENKDYIILIHGKRECPFAMIRGGLKLQKMGFSVLIPVLYAHGDDSLNHYIDYGKYSISQIDSCVNYLTLKGANHIGVSGRSMGATIAIIAGARNSKIDAVAAECPVISVESSISYKHNLYSNLPNFPFIEFKTLAVKQLLNDNLDSLNAANFIKRISPRPLFIMAATEDRVVNPLDFSTLYELAGEPKIWWEAPIDHTKFHSQLKDEFYIRIPAFFQKAFNSNN